jgi:anaerobic selenocysteine-containing dehydrogenase
MSEARAVDPSISRTPIAYDGEDLPTVCVLCSHNCGIRVDVKDGKIAAIRPDERNPITAGYICNKGVTVDKYAHHNQRNQAPMRRREDGTFEEISWETAISEIAAKLGKIRDEHGGQAIGLVGVGGQANHMDAAYATSFLRAIGSRRWFSAYAQEKHQHHLVDHWMFDASPALFFHPDMETTNYLMVMGTNPRISQRGHNPAETFKHLGKKEDCKVVVADPRETETTRGADQHLKVKPGTDAFMLLGMAAAIVQNEMYDAEFLAERSQGFNELRDVLSRVDVSEMAERAGLTPDTLQAVAKDFATSETAAIMWDLGLEMTRFSTLLSYLIKLNLTLTGNIGEGGNIFLESFLPPTLSGSRFEDPDRAVASGIQSIRALGNFGMFSPSLVPEEVLVDHPGRMRAMIVEGSNPMLSYSDTNAWREAIDELELTVVIDPAFSETARLADYVLPVPVGYEKWEIAMFPKRHPQIDVQLRPPVIPGDTTSLPEPEIYVRLAEAMGVSAELPEDLAEIAKTETAEARAMFMATAMGKLGDVAAQGLNAETQMLYWGYRGIGRHFAAPSLTAVWANCVQNVMDEKRRADVVRTLGADWADKDPFALAEEMFSRIMAHPEGVEVACVDPELSTLDRHVGFDDGKIRLSPAPMIAEMERAIDYDEGDTSDFPFVLGNGLRTRWTANTIQRDMSWRKGNGPFCELNIHPEDAEKLGLSKGDMVRIETNRGAIELPTAIDKKLMPGHVWFPNGFGMQTKDDPNDTSEMVGAPMNEITDVADRDPISGCPHHRYMRVKLTPLGAAA